VNTFDRTVSVPRDVVVSAMDGESIVVDSVTGRCCGLDAMGASMWQALAAAGSIADACAALSREYDVDPHRLRSDLEALVDSLVQHGLLEIRPA
jgi:hypothetical protein